MAQKRATIRTHRQRAGANRAIVLVHGYNGSHEDWGRFPAYLASDEHLEEWDIFSFGLTTGSKFDIFSVANLFSPHQSRDPELEHLAAHLRTRIVDGRQLRQYEHYALIAHSMGGLVVQRAVVDYDEVRERLSHMVMFGTPSAGLKKAGIFGRFKRQLSDLMVGSDFIDDLRARWSSEVGVHPEFTFRATAGQSDQFVPRYTSIDPFHEDHRAEVWGDHITMIQPEDANADGPDLVSGVVAGAAEPAGPLNVARLAVSAGEYERAVEEFSRHTSDLDDRHVVLYAMALEATGRGDEAVGLLRGRGDSTDIQGTLAGRFKRRWLDTGDGAEAERAGAMYASAYAEARAAGDAEQALYLGINVAFMQLAAEENPALARATAAEVRKYVADAPQDYWTLATEGEALLHLGEVDLALQSFEHAMREGPDPWQATSTFAQVDEVAERLGREEAIELIPKIFSRG